MGIHVGDELIVDRALDPLPGRVLVVVHDDEHRLGRFEVVEGRACLVTDLEEVPLTVDVVPWGVATTKTLAKVAQRHAKDTATSLCDLTTWTAAQVDDLLAATPTSEVWGIGTRLREGLAGYGIHTALDLARADAGVLRRRWNVVLEKTARELGGTACMPVGFTPKDRQQLMYSRMLGAPVNQRSEMRAVLAQYAATAATRLRGHGLEASMLQAWVSSSRFGERPRHHTASTALDPATSDPLDLIQAARCVLPKMVEGHDYNGAGILLTGLQPAGTQHSLLDVPDPRREHLNTTLDTLTARYGRRTIGYGTTGFQGRQRWDMKRERLSPAATSRWGDLLTVR